MELIARRFRGVIIALVVLGLSASVAFAGHLTLAPTTQPTAAEQGDQGDQADENDNDTPDADENDNDTPDAEDNSTDESPSTDNHGALVSTAAMMTEPEGFKNHGAFVSCVAHMKIAPTLAAGQTLEAFLAALTPADCVRDRGEDTGDASNEDGTADAATNDAFNHGALVSTAAQMADPEGFNNHGEFVSCVARMKDLPVGMSIDQVLAAVTADACRATTDAKSAAKAEKAHGKSGSHKHGRHNRS